MAAHGRVGKILVLPWISGEIKEQFVVDGVPPGAGYFHTSASV